MVVYPFDSPDAHRPKIEAHKFTRYLICDYFGAASKRQNSWTTGLSTSLELV